MTIDPYKSVAAFWVNPELISFNEIVAFATRAFYAVEQHDRVVSTVSMCQQTWETLVGEPSIVDYDDVGRRWMQTAEVVIDAWQPFGVIMPLTTGDLCVPSEWLDVAIPKEWLCE
jgi:hypothetical protein